MSPRNESRTMNERDSSRFYYLVDALAGEPDKADRILHFELEEARKAGGGYEQVVDELRQAIEKISKLDLDDLQRIGVKLAKEPDPLKREMGEAVVWAVDNHKRPLDRDTASERGSIDPETIDLLKLL